jgi:hypothetical protein
VRPLSHPNSPAEPDNLFAGSPGPGAIRGGYGGRRFSLYSWLKLHRLLRPLALGGATVAGWAALRVRGA